MADTRGRQAVKITDPTTNANEAGVTAAGSLKVDLEQVLGATLSVTNGIFVSPITGASWAVTNAGTFAVQESGTQVLVDNAAFTDGTSKVVTGGYVFDEVAGTALTENDVAAARIDSKRAQVGVLEDATTRGQRAAVSAGGALSVSLVASSVTVTVDTELTAVAALADATANPTITNIAGFLMGYNGTTWDRLRSTTAAGLVVDTELPAAAALGDAAANPTTTSVGALALLYNGTTWDRARGAAALADALANPGTGLAQGQDFLMGFNGTTWDRLRTANTGRLQVDVITGGGSNVPTGPTTGYFTKSALAAGTATTTELTTAEAAGSKLWKVDVWSSVPFKAELRTVDNAIESANKGVGGAQAATTWQWLSPHPNFITLGTTAGLDAFRIVCTNLDSNTAADVYATFWYAT